LLEAISQEGARRTVDLANKYRAASLEWDERNRREPCEPLDLQTMTSDWLQGSLDLDERWALFGFLSHFNRAQLTEVKALMWVGGGEKIESEEDWWACKKYAAPHDGDGSIEYMMGKRNLGDLISKGLEVLGY